MRGFSDALEVNVERQGKSRLEALHFTVRKDGRQGWPDRLVLVGGCRHFWWEAKKRKGGKLTKAQRLIIPALRRRGDIVLIRPTLGELLTVANFLAAGNEAGARAAPSAHTEE